MVFWVDFWPHLSASKPLLCLLLLFYLGVMKICSKPSLSSVRGRLSQRNEPFGSLTPVQIAKCFFPIASLMGRDNGSGMLSAHAGDASAVVQHTCVVGTGPLCPWLASPLQLSASSVHLPLGPEGAKGLAPKKGAPDLALVAWPSPQVRLCQDSGGWWAVQARAPDPGPLTAQPGQLFMDSSCCLSEGRAPELPTAGCSMGWMLNCG